MRNVDGELGYSRRSPATARSSAGEFTSQSPLSLNHELIRPVLVQSVATRPPPLKKKQCRSDGAEESGETDVYRESETFRRESLIATLVCFPLGIVSLCFSLEVCFPYSTCLYIAPVMW